MFSDQAATFGLPMHEAYHVAKDQVLATFEKEYVTRLVSRASGNMSRAARLASVDRTTLYRLLERHGFRRDANESITP
jgi:DNA-binding NtrC family response regulator